MASRELPVIDAFSSRRSLQLALDAGQIGTWEWEIAHDRITWSDGFEISHGFEPGALARSLDAYQQHMHPDDRERIVAALQACASAGVAYSVDYRLIDPAGKVHYVEAHGQAVRDANDTITGMVGVCTDVSDRRELLQREREARVAAEISQAQYRSLAEAIPQHVWTAAPDGQLDFVNQRVLEYFGRSFDEMIGSGWHDVVHDEDIGGVAQRWSESLTAGEEYEVEFRLLRSDGVYRWYLGRAIPVRDTSGAIVKWLGTNTDIDDQKTARNVMTAQVEITQLLMNARSLEEAATPLLEAVCRNLFWSCAQLWVVDRSSDTLQRAAGWCSGSMQPCDFDDLAAFGSMRRGEGLPGRIWQSPSPAWIEDLQLDANFPRAAIVRKIGLHSALGFPLIVGGEVSAVLELFSTDVRPINATALTLTSTLGGVIGQFIERQRIDEDLRRLQTVTDVALAHLSLTELLDNLLGKICEALNCDIAVILLFDAESRQLHPEAAFGTDIDLPRELTIAIGESFAGRVAQDERTHVVHDIPHMDFIRPEIRSLGLDTAIGVPLVGHDGLIGVLIVGSRSPRWFPHEDIDLAELVADRFTTALENSALYEQARTANRMKDRFLSIASHDLRTPMTAILGWTRMLRSEIDEETRIEALNSIEQSVRSQAQLIEDLLDSTRIREGKLVLNRQRADLAPIVASAVATVASSAADRGVDLQHADMTEAIVFGDPGRLQQVVWNLLANAIKFTPAGKSVRTTLTANATAATIVVEDQGEGIAPDFLRHIFKPFEQDAKGERAGGLGLGLHIVDTIVRMHGGTIEAASEGHGKGARFIVRLPLATAAPSA